MTPQVESVWSISWTSTPFAAIANCSCWSGTCGLIPDDPDHPGNIGRTGRRHWYPRDALVRLCAPFAMNCELAVEVAPLFNQIKDIRTRTDVLRGYL